MIVPTWVTRRWFGFRPLSGAAVALFRESEIQQLYDPARGREDVRWFEVAMNDPFGVRGFERGGNLRGEPQRPQPAEAPAAVHRKRSAPRRCTP